MIDITPIIISAIFVVLFLALEGFAVFLWRIDDGYAMPMVILLAVLAFAALIPAVLVWFPFDMDYHRWDEVSGEVASIDARLMADGDGMTENFVVTFEGSEQQYRCDDSRCATIKQGDTLTLGCKKVWEWASTHGYECRFRDHESAP